MKLKFALVGLVALSSATLVAGTASAMPLAALGQSMVSDVENVAVACGPNGCIRTAPVYRYGGYGVHRYGYGYAYRGGGYRHAYGYHGGYRRY